MGCLANLIVLLALGPQALASELRQQHAPLVQGKWISLLQGEPGAHDGYLDTDDQHPRREDPVGDPKGDKKGWGPDADNRETSPAGKHTENFSLLHKLFGDPQCTGFFKCHGDVKMGHNGLFVLSFALMVYCFKALKVMSEDYWVPAIFSISRKLKIQPDIAGATLLAFGSSAPEFCCNTVASFFIINECGVGDIIGSAVHNVLLIVGVSGLFAGKALDIWWFPLTRDSFFFLISIIELVTFLWDEQIMVWECLVMIFTYVAYIAFMFLNSRIREFVEDDGGCWRRSFPCLNKGPAEEGEEEDDEPEGCWPYDPLEIFWTKTMPCPQKSKWACFSTSLASIAVLSYIMVDAATVTGNILNIPSLFMGLVFLAAGTSIPDAFGSMAAAKKGEGDMAVSNALGSNVFDVLIGLAVPWLIAASMGRPIVFLGVSRLIYWICLLVAVLFVFVGSVALNRWKLNYSMGVFLCSLYGLYVIWALLRSYAIVP